MKEFNTTGTCIPEMHYMVDISNKCSAVAELIEKRKYFTINRSRQYGKTTTLYLLKKILKSRMQVVSISFEGIGEEAFNTNASFVRMFTELCSDYFKFTTIEKSDAEKWSDISDFNEEKSFKYLSDKITDLCEKYEIVLMIDEMDKCSDNQVFLNFLGMLRDKYLSRNEGEDYTFKSVILAGVYDIKNLKLKFRPDERKKYNSPWNIAVDFNIDMSFHPEEIATMLSDYENDVHTGMNIETVSEEIYHYTSGYPYLVSWLCKWIDECGNRDWTSEGLKKAVKEYYNADSTLKDDLIKNYENNRMLSELIDDMLLRGEEYSYVSTDEAVSAGRVFGIFKKSDDENNRLMISCIVFENILTEHILMKYARAKIIRKPEKSQFIKEDGHLDMVRVLERFQALMKAEYREKDERFYENQGRLLFLCFLKPIINGTGFYYVEPQTKSDTRMDIVVTYLDEEFIIELKIWNGDQYRKNGIKQLCGYLDSREQKRGYLVSFSFLKNKEYTAGYLSDIKNDEIQGIEEKEIYEVVL